MLFLIEILTQELYNGYGSCSEGTSNVKNSSKTPETYTEKNGVKTPTGKLPDEGQADSKDTLYNPDGSPKQDRWYGPDGKAEKDRDYNHGGVGHEFPHDHEWDWNKNPPRQPGVPVPTPYPNTINTSSNSTWWYVPAGIGLVVIGGLATAALLTDDATGIGVLDDTAIPVTAGMVAKGFEMVFAR